MAFLPIDKRKKPFVLAGCVVIILCLIYSIVSALHRGAAGSQNSTKILNNKFAQTATDETAKLAGQNGKIVLIVLDEKMKKFAPIELMMQTQIAAFQGKRTFTVIGMEKFNTDTVLGPGYAGIPNATYLEYLKKHPEADAFVSLIGSLEITDEEIAALPEKRPKFLAINTLRLRGKLKPLLEKHVIQTAIYPRRTPPTEIQKKEPFDRVMEVFTLANASVLDY